MNELGKIIAGLISEDGPLPLDRYMALCLGHPQHGYYMTRDPFGVSGDFTTAPEISQVFGELIGVWVLQVWQSMGEPRQFALLELGPGRGTMMVDILRVLGKVEKCRKAVKVHFVETSPVLRQAQATRVPHATWHHSTASLPALPTILIANEFFDALPIRQYERRGGRVFERVVGEDMQIGITPTAQVFPVPGEGVFEDHSIHNAIASQLGDHISTLGGAALIIDYGHARSALGDTLQALYRHKACSITEHPGEADITSHVDFESLGRAFQAGGGRVAGLMTQGAFLEALGLQARTDVLARTAKGETRVQLVAASERLAHSAQMGHLFKVMAVTGAEVAPPYPFGV